jgi:hypothetical protein
LPESLTFLVSEEEMSMTVAESKWLHYEFTTEFLALQVKYACSPITIMQQPGLTFVDKSDLP